MIKEFLLIYRKQFRTVRLCSGDVYLQIDRRNITERVKFSWSFRSFQNVCYLESYVQIARIFRKDHGKKIFSLANPRVDIHLAHTITSTFPVANAIALVNRSIVEPVLFHTINRLLR